MLKEYNEVFATTTNEERIEELANMLETIQALANLENKILNDVIEVAKAKRLKRGGFEKNIFRKGIK